MLWRTRLHFKIHVVMLSVYAAAYAWPPGSGRGVSATHGASVRILLLMTCLVCPLGSLQVPISPGGFPTDIIPTLLRLHMSKSRLSAGLGAVGHRYPQLSHLLGSHEACCFFLQNVPGTHWLLSIAPSPVEVLSSAAWDLGSSDQRCSGLCFFSSNSCWAQRLERSFQKTTLCMSSPAQKSPITA